MECGIEFVAYLDTADNLYTDMGCFNTQHYSIYDFNYYAVGKLLPGWDFAAAAVESYYSTHRIRGLIYILVVWFLLVGDYGWDSPMSQSCCNKFYYIVAFRNN